MSALRVDDLGRVLCVEYDYNYQANDGKQVSIKQGETYILIKKSNADWWQVIRLDQRKPFYIPASYVKELKQKTFPEHTYFKKAYTTLQKTLKAKNARNSKDNDKKTNERTIYLTKSREDINVVSSENSKLHITRASTDSLDHLIENENPYDEVPFQIKIDELPKSSNLTQVEPEYENLEVVQTSQNQPPTFLLSSSSSDDHRTHIRQLSTSTTLSTFKPNIEDVPTEIQEDRWEPHLDTQTGTTYYYNSTSGEMRDYPPSNLVIPKTSTRSVSPPPVPDISKKPTRKTLSPPSLLQRRLTSPERFRNRKNWPVAKYRRDDDKVKSRSPSPSQPRGTLLRSNVDRLADDNVFHDSTNVAAPSGLSKSNKSPRVSFGSSGGRSPTTSPTSSRSTWDRDLGADGEVVFINKQTGERWHQLLDETTQRYYYFNEITRSTTWLLPQTDSHDDLQSLDDDFSTRKIRTIDSAEVSNHRTIVETIKIHEKNLSLPRDITSQDIGSASVVTRREPKLSKVAVKKKPTNKSNVGGQTKSLDRSNLARSMIILRDDHCMPAMDYLSQINTSTLKNSKTEQNFLSEGNIQLEGRLNWTKLYEAGKKQRKNWNQQWVVLLANNLLFYKDQKQAASSKTYMHGRPDSSCDLRGAVIDWAHEKSSKKNVLHLQTIRGLQMLLQSDNLSTVKKWLESIQATITRINQNDPLDPNTVDFSKLVEDEDNNENEGGKSKKKKEKKKSKAPSRSSSDAKNSDKVRKFELLKKFLGRRPTFESLQERGIIKETVFGCPLKKLCEKERSSVPCFIQMCVKEVEKRGLDVDGIYRVSGNLSHVQKLRYLIDREEEVDLSDPEWEDIHIITGALKMFLRELPDPVIPFGFFDKFIAACKICNEEERFMTMKGLVSVLPKVNHDTLQYLLTHFKRVVEHSVENRMQVQNIAIVFGPTLLLKPPDASTTDPQAAAAAASGHMAVYMIYQNQIIDILLTEYQRIFGLKR